ncbi:MAG: PilW family protein [Pseudoxanthomonas sp.]
MNPAPCANGRRGAAGLSLIELMIALLLGILLMLGMVQIFAASKASYRLSEGVSRTQENGRFALDFLQRDIRMVGHFGCKSDQTLFLEQAMGSDGAFENALDVSDVDSDPADYAANFALSIQGYEASGTEPGKSLVLATVPATGGTAYGPALPAAIAKALANRVDGSDILVLRYLAPEGAFVAAAAADGTYTLDTDAASWEKLRGGIASPGLFGISNCHSATIFQASDAAAAAVKANAAPANLYAAGALLYRAESRIYYVGLNASGVPALYRLRYVATPGTEDGSYTKEELVEGVASMQLLYGQDRASAAASAPSGAIDSQYTAATLGRDADAWRRVGSVQIGLVLVSPNPASAVAPQVADAALVAQGVSFASPADGRYRNVYQSTVALRNRLFGN